SKTMNHAECPAASGFFNSLLKAAAGEHVAGTYRQSLTLSSGRFAMIDNGLGFQLVPWSREIDRKLGQHIAGVARAGGGIEWSLGRKRDLGL
ncbi:DUF3363 domain-containing protein, partial [Bosea vestrisii]